MKFILVKIKSWDAPYWLQDAGQYWRNFVGGRVPKSKDDKILDTIDVRDIEDLDWSHTGLIKNSSPFGWLSPSGIFYGCSNREHDLIVWLIIKRPLHKLEEEGWCRVFHDHFICISRLTAEQRNWLSYHGHHVEDCD